MKKGFTLVELSIVLIIMGLLTGGAFQLLKVMNEKARATEAKNTLNAAKEGIIAFSINNNRLPSAAEFTAMNFTGSGNTPIFYNSDPARQANNGLCGATSTPLQTINNSVLPILTTTNVGFVLAIAGENMNVQTGRVGNNIQFYTWNTPNIDDLPVPINRRGPYDDFYTQVSLGELQSLVGCQMPTLANTSIHQGTVGAPYTVTFSGNGGNGTYTFSRTAGAFPAGFTLVGATLSGTPLAPGTSNFTIQITSGGMSTSRQYALVIN
jgi:prepilin-type N-terminal cleavage/methylation domain-containing protein